MTIKEVEALILKKVIADLKNTLADLEREILESNDSKGGDDPGTREPSG